MNSCGFSLQGSKHLRDGPVMYRRPSPVQSPCTRDCIVPRGFRIRCLSKTSNLVDVGGIVLPDNVDFVVDGERVAQVFGGRVLLVLVDRIHRNLRPVGFKFTTQHFNIAPPVCMVERVAPAMHGHETMTLLDPINEGLSVRQRQITRGIREDDAVCIFLNFQGSAFPWRLLVGYPCPPWHF